jgi:hypothetical protein
MSFSSGAGGEVLLVVVLLSMDVPSIWPFVSLSMAIVRGGCCLEVVFVRKIYSIWAIKTDIAPVSSGM